MVIYRCIYYSLFFVGLFLMTKTASTIALVGGLAMLLISIQMRYLRKGVFHRLSEKKPMSWAEKDLKDRDRLWFKNQDKTNRRK